MNNDFRSGFVTIMGRPNVGKSTLLNSFLGEKVAIITSKPQTTRNNIRGIISNSESQIVFVDTPGIHAAKTKLGENMVKLAENSVADADIILLVTAARDGGYIHKMDMEIVSKLSKSGTSAKKILVINKIDTIDRGEILPMMDAYKELCNFDEIVPISALKGDNLMVLREAITKYLPIGPRYFPEGMVTDASDAFLVAEMIREKALYLLQEEIPHGINVEIMSMKVRPDKPILDIEANIYCDKASHKGMIIGKQGAMLKQIATRARQDIERIYEEKINLQIWVKIKENWRDSDYFIKNFGFRNET
ncbi:MAG: GTPase Era [Defluviitaleaceae bacterium]|nr:GTPase Era [Defluviitaleaceae bacterium]